MNAAYAQPASPPPPHCPPDGFMPPRPGMRPPCPPPRRVLSAPARVLLWILGVIVGVTVVFGCVVFWMFGINYVYSSFIAQPGSSASEQQTPDGNEFFFYYPDGEGGYSITEPTTPDGSTQSGSKAGLGVTVGQLELEFNVDGIYDCGLLIMSINEDSAFTGTDVRVNDLIVAAEGVAIETIDELSVVLDARKPGDKVSFTIARYENGVADTFNVTVTLIELEG